MQKTLAIVIPAYKPDYLEKTLRSLADQTCQDFSLYIGDDASPANLASIINPFKSQMNIHYLRFSSNLGKNDLVAHWERCIHLIKDEEWICLFSDDDVMGKGCVEAFHSSAIAGSVDVVHFDIDLIDENGKLIRRCAPYPQNISSAQFFDHLFRHQIDARMPEFVFRRSFLLKNGITPFKLAWRSDTATVMTAALSGGIQTITGPDCHIQWRASQSNISGLEYLKKTKNLVNVDFFNWAHDFYRSHAIEIPMSRFYLLKTIVFALEWYGWRGLITDGFLAARKLKDAAGLRLLVFIFVIYRLFYRLHE